MNIPVQVVITPWRWWSHWGQGFFGLTHHNKLHVHEEIFTLLNYGNGGYTFDEVYAMPVHLRQYYLKRLAKEYEHIAKERQKAFDKARSNQKS